MPTLSSYFVNRRSNWKSMPYTLGSYSFIPVGARADDIDSLAEPVLDPTSDKVRLHFVMFLHSHMEIWANLF